MTTDNKAAVATTSNPSPSPAPEKKAEPKGKFIKFDQPLTLVEGDIFNTFRIGDDWPERFKEGDVVNLIDVNTNESYGDATVQVIHTGRYGDLSALSADNHLYSKLVDVNREQTTSMMTSELTRIYGDDGKVVINDDTQVTVVYLVAGPK